MKPVVLDTNIVLDLLLFQDPQVQGLQQALARGELHWLATAPMREELVQVLAYPHLSAVLAHRSFSAASLLAQWDARVTPADVAPSCAVRCRDPDDQMFIDLAVMHRAALLSKDRLVLRLAKRLLALGVVVGLAGAAIAPLSQVRRD